MTTEVEVERRIMRDLMWQGASVDCTLWIMNAEPIHRLTSTSSLIDSMKEYADIVGEFHERKFPSSQSTASLIFCLNETSIWNYINNNKISVQITSIHQNWSVFFFIKKTRFSRFHWINRSQTRQRFREWPSKGTHSSLVHRIFEHRQHLLARLSTFTRQLEMVWLYICFFFFSQPFEMGKKSGENEPFCGKILKTTIFVEDFFFLISGVPFGILHFGRLWVEDVSVFDIILDGFILKSSRYWIFNIVGYAFYSIP